MLGEELRTALRQALRRPALTAAVAAALALSIAAASTAFGLARSVLWRPLPFADAPRLVFVWEEVEREGQRYPSRVTGVRYAAWREHSSDRIPFSSMALFGAATFTIDTPGGAQVVRGVRVSAGYFDTLGIAPAIGRTFTPTDEVPGNHRVAVVSETFWREQFGGRRDVVGAPLTLGGETHIVVGVMPRAVYPAWPVNPAAVTIDSESQQLWVPIPRTPQLDQSSRAHVFGVVARLADGVSDIQAREELGRATDASASDSHAARITPLRDQFVRDARSPLLALAGAALAVLLIACANLASLYVSAFEARRREFAVRAAIGGGVTKLVRQVAFETLMPAIAGGASGLVITRMALTAIPTLLPPTVPFLTTPDVDPFVAAFAASLAVLAALMMTVWPITRLVRSAPAPRGVAEQTRGTIYRVLVVTQVALAVMLAAAAGLLSRSLMSVQSRDPAVVIDDVLVGEVALPLRSSPSEVRRIVAAETALLAAVASLPRVRGVTAAYDHPLEANWSEVPTIVGDTTAPERRQQAELRIVSPGYFDTMGIDILDGRGLSERDDLDSAGAAVINEALAREIGGRMLGRRIRTGTPRFLFGSLVPDEFVIVGVVKNERFRGLEEPALPAFYLSTRQFPQTSFALLAHIRGDPLAAVPIVTAAIHAVDRTATFSRPTSLRHILAEQLAARRVTTGVLGGFALAALALAALGLYSLLTVFVSRRVREIGVRVALGASPGAVARRVLQESIVSTAAGIAIGSLLALACGRLIESLLVGVSAHDPVTLVSVAATLISVSILTAAIPAARAARIDPVEALRAD